MISASIAAVIFVVSFLLGSIPNGVIVGKVFYHTDIRTVGSGNIGTTNAIRALGKKGGYAVFLLDFAKGVLSGAIALAIMGATASVEGALTCADGLCLAFLGAGLGHIFSPWLGFKGGKGIAVCVGAMFVTFGPLAALIELALFVVVVPLHGPLGLLGRLDGGGRLRHHGGRGHLGAPRQYRSAARRHRAPHRFVAREGQSVTRRGVS